MISIPTVLILGAGASREYGFRVGRPFRNAICDLRTNTDYMFGCRHIGELERSQQFLDRFRHSEIGSPDRFLEIYPEYTEVGKFAIAKVLTEVETDSNVFPTTGRITPWYQYLVECLDFDNRNYRNNTLTILTFNYDRSLEYFIWKVIEARYFSDTRKIRRLWRTKPRIIHLHGSLGEFDPIESNGRPYEPPIYPEDPFPDDLVTAANGIKIIHEVDADTPEFDEAESALRQAIKIIFLGFGFDERNVRRLRVFEEERERSSIFGTGQGLSPGEQQRIRSVVFHGFTKESAFGATDIRGLLQSAGLEWELRR